MDHDLDLLRLHDVISHVTIRLAIGHFLLVVLWNQTFISNGFRDIRPQTSFTRRHSTLRIRNVPPVQNLNTHFNFSLQLYLFTAKLLLGSDEE